MRFIPRLILKGRVGGENKRPAPICCAICAPEVLCLQHTDPDTCVHAQCTSRLGGWEPTSMYVSYMHVHMYMYWRADTARMRIRRTGSLGPYIGTRRRVVCVRACVLARVTSGKEMPSCPGKVVGCAGDSSCRDCPTWLPFSPTLHPWEGCGATPNLALAEARMA